MVEQSKKGDTVWFRGFPVKVVSVDMQVDQAVVQLGKRQSIVNLSDLRK